MGKLAAELKIKGKYTSSIDTELAKNYYESISSNKLQIRCQNGTYKDADSKALWSFIETRLEQHVQES